MHAVDGVCLKVAGALSGVVRMPSLQATVGDLRQEVARLLNQPASSNVKLIVGGRTLQDDSKQLAEYSIKDQSRVLVTAGAAAGATLDEQQHRMERLDKLKRVVDAMASRDGSGLTDDYEFSLENQDGQPLQLAAEDRKALVMGLALHDRARATLASRNWAAALDELVLAEEAFGCVKPDLLGHVDNVALLMLDIVWCCFQLQDVGRLAVSSQRLQRSQEMLQAAHGPNQERLRTLHGNFKPEKAIYVRLQLLQGVVAHHMGDRLAALRHLQAAQQLLESLQVPEEALTILQEMGYSQREATRALRFSGADIALAVNALTQQRAQQQERKQQRAKQRAWNKERGKYGKTPGGKYVDSQHLEQLCDLGFERAEAAETLRREENELSTALDILSDPVRRGALQLSMVAAQMLEADKGPQDVDAAAVSELVGAGYLEKAARQALKDSRDDLDAALALLESQGNDVKAPEARSTADAAGAGPSSSKAATSSSRSQLGSRPPSKRSKTKTKTESDEELESEMARLVSQDASDPMAAYDLDLQEEGEAIHLYLALVSS